ncbi:hypothetical protein CCAX7_008540 [Capsulimonas corticalis]|uniref:Uncharacterized protein n=1 Tax=Capsulimonas corticalis TaxID=2219043 RepID=A0A402CTZ5_9BACT|nr:hypothetical protein CCAX7_008540 [Capsulimonas corticalis]
MNDPMPSTPLKHIFLNDKVHNQKYKRPGTGGGGNSKILERNRLPHAERLATEFDAAWTASETTVAERLFVSVPARDGIYLEFSGLKGYDLMIKSLEDRRQGVRLMSTRSINDTVYATVYVPRSRRAYFAKKIRDYGNSESRFGQPKNKASVESIESIRKAIIASFWLDNITLLPSTERVKCEVWLHVENEETENRFRDTCKQLSIHCENGSIKFPERSVLIVTANLSDLHQLIEAADFIAELRRAKDTARYFLELENADQTNWSQELLGRLRTPREPKVAISLLDTGVNNGHPLLQPLLSDSDCHTFNTSWGVTDHHGHGTLMCGLVGYGNLRAAMENSEEVFIDHKLESVKILPPNGENDPKLYGHIVSQAISLVEITSPKLKHITCMAVTATDDRDRGRPSSWSAAIDAITSGADDNQKRLFIVSAGNVSDPDHWLTFPESNKENSVHDPGQSWNALTIGAYTEMISITDPTFDGYVAIAAAGELSPFSSTSATWDMKWPIKPEVLFEGGNAAASLDGTSASVCDDLSMLSTYRQHARRQFDSMHMTSAATGLAANLAARIQDAYPDAWPETVRALMVHSAEWTEAMKQQFLSDETKTSYNKLLRICGYGVPLETRALECAGNYLTLITQNELQPFSLGKDNRPSTNEMDLHELPWPKDELLKMGDVQVTLKITLSYFVEPGPGERGWKDRYRYASHGLRFDVNMPGETNNEFVGRMNAAARDDNETYEFGSTSGRWLLGTNARDVGSVHSDSIHGTAADIATCNFVGIYPVGGWWRERSYLNKYANRTRYSLIVSISTPAVEVDLYTPVLHQVSVASQVQQVETTVPGI